MYVNVSSSDYYYYYYNKKLMRMNQVAAADRSAAVTARNGPAEDAEAFASIAGNLSENWQRFKKRFELYLQATAVDKAPKSDASKTALLLSFAGDEALDIFNNFQYGPGESKDSYGTVVQEFNAYFSEYIPGKHLVLADMLSRSTADNQDKAGATDDVEVHAVQLLGNRVTAATQKELQAATARDCYLQSVITSLSLGLPVQGDLKPFEQELSFVNGILLKASKVVVPKSMRQTMLQRIHAGHPACKKMQGKSQTSSILARAQHCDHFYGANVSYMPQVRLQTAVGTASNATRAKLCMV
ncbi:uncharacterized protein LOC119436743 [Dermacentor silvarum]|uniref:uncharacterized protein LOC119436743 n=1 Tax=Dermacentor silvarum TaxID=543639 RepID=UPI0018999A10|nr:uncharacterized protein LOC119436743 [Dermacentor silvarum]